MEESELFVAVTTGDESSVRRLLDNNVVPFTVTNDNGENFLHILAKQNLAVLSPEETTLRRQRRSNIIYMLCDDGLNPSHRNGVGQTPMHYAIQNSDPYLLKTLLQCSPNPPFEICDAIVPSPLQEVLNKFKPGLCDAIRRRCIADVRRIVNMWCRTDGFVDGYSLKELALESGHEEIISLILGVEPSMRLVHHVLARNVEKVRKILCTERVHLNLDLRNMSDQGAPILYYAIANKDVDIVRLLVLSGCHVFTLMRDADNQEIPVLFSALSAEMSPELADALMPRNLLGQQEVIRRLLYKSRTILEVALDKRVPPRTFELLLHRGGAELLVGRNQETFKELPPDTVEYLEGVTLYQEQIANLARAVEDGDYERFEELRTYKSTVFRTNMCWQACQKGDGQPLLHRAVLFNRPSIVKTILQNIPYGQSIDTLLDQHHRTALHYAYGMRNGEHLVQLLMNAGCSEHTLDRIGKEPLDFKVHCGSPAMETLLRHIRNKVPFEESRVWNSAGHQKIKSKCCQGASECNERPVLPHKVHALTCGCQATNVPDVNKTIWCAIL
ncbi:uncharacterized protein LOC144113914 isoform X3 [Amblyomma americanum]